MIEQLVPIVMETIPDPEARAKLWDKVIEVFTNADWDTEDEAYGLDPVLDSALNAHYEKTLTGRDLAEWRAMREG
jgi:hypothetical protein